MKGASNWSTGSSNSSESASCPIDVPRVCLFVCVLSVSTPFHYKGGGKRYSALVRERESASESDHQVNPKPKTLHVTHLVIIAAINEDASHGLRALPAAAPPPTCCSVPRDPIWQFGCGKDRETRQQPAPQP